MSKGFEGILALPQDSPLFVRIKQSGKDEMFKAILVEDFAFASTATWSGDSTGDGGGMIEGITKLVSDAHVKTAFQSTLSWSGSERPTFSVSMIVLALRAEDNVIALCDPLHALTYPQKIGEGGLINTPPLGFHVNPSRTAVTAGSVSCAIGRWFMATGLVVADVQIIYSKQQTKKYKPLYAMVTVTFRAAVMPSAATVQQYFIK